MFGNGIQIIVVPSHILILLLSFLPETYLNVCFTKHEIFPIIIFIILMLITLVFYILSCGDPGFINDDDDQPLDCENLFFCQTCQKYVPLRASHCRQCNKCVLRRDHHCPFIGECVGMKNHLFFMLYMICESSFCSFSMYIFSSGMRDNLPFKQWLYTSLPCTLMFCLSASMIIQPALLIPFHTYLIFANRTTWEILKSGTISYLRNWHKSMSPFSMGLIHNLVEFITMRWSIPTYKIPETEEEIFEWKRANSFVSNDKYECC